MGYSEYQLHRRGDIFFQRTRPGPRSLRSVLKTYDLHPICQTCHREKPKALPGCAGPSNSISQGSSHPYPLTSLSSFSHTLPLNIPPWLIPRNDDCAPGASNACHTYPFSCRPDYLCTMPCLCALRPMNQVIADRFSIVELLSRDLVSTGFGEGSVVVFAFRRRVGTGRARA